MAIEGRTFFLSSCLSHIELSSILNFAFHMFLASHIVFIAIHYRHLAGRDSFLRGNWS
ncbi:hypothetical protein M430DRAFT_181570 [Amorphotheca resinae ATCC 22711]|uniref:Uncharacterized protein n=1 Tax=Amorphotheca resinae ATCC 22711 TaxID=857342 RepID=A0A2T3ARH9_AMORE|nr:hypothetical protein M430DRAFT_181570 [Amorphotheca resinae ATCC 22711]PSS08979.1 hypothetical protein M430DRAFT_181570 [Amorphotheca resinae ATCC 22711]